MTHVWVQLTLQDYARWRPVFNELGALRKSHGSKGGRLFRKADAPNEVAVLFEWDDRANARRYFESDELRQGMQRAGVSGRPEVIYLDALEHLSV